MSPARTTTTLNLVFSLCLSVPGPSPVLGSLFDNRTKRDCGNQHVRLTTRMRNESHRSDNSRKRIITRVDRAYFGLTEFESSERRHVGNAWAHGGDEGRGKLR